MISGADLSACRASRALTRPLAASFLLALFLLLGGCDSGEDKHRFSGSTMGTIYMVTLVGVDARIAERVEREVAESLVHINDIFSTYIADSELNRLNRHPVGEPLEVSAELFDVLAMSVDIYRRSGGAFDPTVMPLVNLWGFGPAESRDQAPSEASIAAALDGLGLDGLELDADHRTATRIRDITIDLSAIAKGYGVDMLAALVETHGVRNYMVDIGGELRVGGHNPHGTEWRIAVESASEVPGGLATIVAVSNRAVATSGDYRNFFEQEGRRFSHTIDPRNGYPIDHNLASVTVIAPNAALADGWSTAFMVVGADQALLIADREDIAVYLLVKAPDGFEARHNEAFTPYIQPMSREAE